MKIKGTLLEKLALGAPFLNQSVTNKLTSSLAIFILYCIPDIWPEPIQDLATMWNDKAELLLRQFFLIFKDHIKLLEFLSIFQTNSDTSLFINQTFV